MGWKNTYEMAAVMVLPVIPFLCLVRFGVTESAWCGPYCIVTLLAMLALMRFRRSEYTTPMKQAVRSARRGLRAEGRPAHRGPRRTSPGRPSTA